VVDPDSSTYEEARKLQAARFARASMPLPQAPSYLEIVQFDPELMIPLVVCRQESEQVIGTAILELPSPKSFAAMRFAPGSATSQIISRGAFAEIRGFATRFDLEWWEVVDLIDALAGIVLLTAKQLGIEWLWAQPRYSAMSMFLAEIPGLLPPYRFTPCFDVIGWHEDEEAFAELRALRLKELPTSAGSLPLIYQITPTTLSKNLAQRLAAYEQRRHQPDLPHLLQAAMRQAHRQVRADAQQRQSEAPMLKRSKDTTSVVETPSEAVPPPPASNVVPAQSDQSFLYPGASSEAEAAYLSAFVERGGAAAQRYKALSYDLLHLAPGMQVLDVGCGIGADLPALAERVGDEGLVVGIDQNPHLLQTAQQMQATRNNVRVSLGKAEQLPFAHRSFDGVRADRMLQYLAEPAVALAEMWRVLRPEGVVTLVEPDWQAIALYPASPAGGDDDHTLHAILQRTCAHPLIGRRLSGLLHQPHPVWDDITVHVETFTLTTWGEADALLVLSQTAQALAQAEPTLAADIQAWLQAVSTASEHGEFFVSMPLYFASARKVAAKP
jgi:SAM-dependent methyltransferase